MKEKHIKNHELWLIKKKELEMRTFPADFFFLEGEVWWAAIGVNIGSEIDGKNNNYKRPVLVLKKINAELLSVIPISSTIKELPGFYPISYRGNRQVLLLLQIRTISAKRLLRPIFRINDIDFYAIKRAGIDFLFFDKTKPPLPGESQQT